MDNDMILHFALTSDELIYPYYLSIISALKTQNVDKIMLWCFREPTGKYYPLLKDKIQLKIVNKPDIPCLKSKDAHFQAAHHKDLLQWRSLYEYGGMFFDLDTFSLKDAADLLDDTCEIVAALEAYDIDDFEESCHMGIVMAKQGSGIIKEIWNNAIEATKQSDMIWNATGGHYGLVFKKYRGRVKFTEWGILGGHGDKVVRWWDEDGYIWDKARVLHLYGKGMAIEFSRITEDYIKASNSVYAKKVRETLDHSEWGPFIMANEDMRVHFLNTGVEFPYMYYLGVMTALKVYGDRVLLWVYGKEPEGKYYQALKDKVEIRRIPKNEVPDFPALKNMDDQSRYVTIFDYLIWRIVYHHGGMIMGLDSLTIKSHLGLLEPDKEILAPVTVDDALSFAMHGAIVRKGSKIALKVINDGINSLNNPAIKWGEVGVIPYICHVKINIEKVTVLPFGMVGRPPNNLFADRESLAGGIEFNDNVRTFGLYSSTKKPVWITEEYVRRSDSLYAHLVRQVLAEDEWSMETIKPIFHFALTGGDLNYVYYLAIMSAIKTQDASEFVLWCFEEPDGIYWDKLKRRVKIGIVPRPDFPAIKKQGEHFFAVHIKDWLEAKVLYEFGGAFMDLDTLSVKNICDLLDGNYEVIAPYSSDSQLKVNIPFNAGTIIAKRGSDVVKQLLDEVTASLNREDIAWADTGPKAFSKVFVENVDRVKGIEYGILDGFGEKVWGHWNIYEEGKLWDKVRVIHLYGGHNPEPIKNIDDDWIRKSNSTYATAVKSVLTEDEWQIRDSIEVYDRKYYEAIERGEIPMARRLAGILLDMFHPRSVIDLGCANGFYLRPFKESWVEVHGIDNAAIAKEISSIPEDIEIADLTQELKIDKHDLGLCIEVVEHIDKRYEKQVFDNICKSSDLIVFTGATLDQGGEGHVNCQSKEYWRDRFTERGFVLDVGDTNKLIAKIQEGYHVRWFPKNVMVFRRIIRDDNDKAIIKTNLPVQKPKTLDIQSKIIKDETIHILGLPHLPTLREISSCAYTAKVIKMIDMAKMLGYKVIFYGVEGSVTNADEFIQVSTKQVLKETYGDYDWKSVTFKHGWGDKAYTVFNENAIKELAKRAKPTDYLLIPWDGDRPVYDALGTTNPKDDNKLYMAIEMGIGYACTFSHFRVFESYAWMHHIYGIEIGRAGKPDCNGNTYDVVIPNYFDKNDFEFGDVKDKEPYVLILGRVAFRKGLVLAGEVCEAMGLKLVIAGQDAREREKFEDGTEGRYLIDMLKASKNIEYIGFVGPKARKELLKKASALFVPTQYVGPFEGVSIEAAMSGTPVLTTDWGAFTENVLPGITGYRCRTKKQFIAAIENLDKIRPIDCYNWAVNNFSLEVVAKKYQEYFNMILDAKLHDGWKTLEGYKSNIDWLNRYYPNKEVI